MWGQRGKWDSETETMRQAERHNVMNDNKHKSNNKKTKFQGNIYECWNEIFISVFRILYHWEIALSTHLFIYTSPFDTFTNSIVLFLLNASFAVDSWHIHNDGDVAIAVTAITIAVVVVVIILFLPFFHNIYAPTVQTDEIGCEAMKTVENIFFVLT